MSEPKTLNRSMLQNIQDDVEAAQDPDHSSVRNFQFRQPAPVSGFRVYRVQGLCGFKSARIHCISLVGFKADQ